MKRFALAVLSICAFAHADVVTSIAAGKVINASTYAHGGAAETLAPGVTWSSNNARYRGGAVYGYTGTYRFGANGEWQGEPMEAVNSGSGSMTFSFSSPVAAVGGMLNYAPGNYGNTPLEIEAFNAAGHLLESYDPVFSTGGSLNAGEFYGFSDESADISSFVVSGSYAALRDLAILRAPIAAPEPAGILLLGTGLAGIVSRRRKKV